MHNCWYLIAHFSVLPFWAELETFSFSLKSNFSLKCDHLEDVFSAGQLAGPLKLSSSQIHAALRTAVPRFLHANTHTHKYFTFKAFDAELTPWYSLLVSPSCQDSGFWGLWRRRDCSPPAPPMTGSSFSWKWHRRRRFSSRYELENLRKLYRETPCRSTTQRSKGQMHLFIYCPLLLSTVKNYYFFFY